MRSISYTPIAEQSDVSMQVSSTVCSCSYAPSSISRKHLANQSYTVLHTCGRSSRRQGRRRQALRSVAALSPDQLHDLLPQLLHHASLAYERVTLPCSAMNCGDVVYKRSAGWLFARSQSSCCYFSTSKSAVRCLSRVHVYVLQYS